MTGFKRIIIFVVICGFLSVLSYYYEEYKSNNNNYTYVEEVEDYKLDLSLFTYNREPTYLVENSNKGCYIFFSDDYIRIDISSDVTINYVMSDDYTVTYTDGVYIFNIPENGFIVLE